MRLSLDGVAVARGGIAVLERVSCDIPAGEALILRGPNGIGKTTLLRAVAGLGAPVAGRIAPGPDAVAYAGHLNGVKATMRVGEALGFWAGLHGRAGVAEALAAYGLTDLSDRPGQHLSAGQARRLALARMMVTGRPVWVLDEPTVSLDAEGVGCFAAAVATHLAAGGTALMATHIDLGIPAEVLDLTPFRAQRSNAIVTDAFADPVT